MIKCINVSKRVFKVLNFKSYKLLRRHIAISAQSDLSPGCLPESTTRRKPKSSKVLKS